MIRTLTRTAAILAILSSTSPAFADCTRTPSGRTVCDNGQSAGGYNPNTGNAFKSQTNENTGVTTTQARRGGTAMTKDGKGVVTTPGGKTCVKGANNQGCN
jgi:hypothetical protein